MAKKSSGCGWLVIACLFGLITLAVVGGGGYSVWQTSSTLSQHQETLDRNRHDLDELVRAKKKSQKNVDLMNSINVLTKDLVDDEFNRNVAVGITAGSVCPGFFTLMFIVMAVILYLKSGKTKPRTSAEP